MDNLVLTAFTAMQPPADLPKSPDSPFFWMPVQASKLAAEIDWLFDYIMWISVLSAVLLMGSMVYFVSKYKAKSRKDKPGASSDHNTFLEIFWSVVPLIAVVAMFVWGFQGFVALRTAPRDAYEIHVTGQKWKWLFQYENGYTDDVLHAPVGRNVRIVINSVDVLHSLFLPSFRQKIDAVPGRYTELWFEATVPGEHPVFCAEYCGTSHSDMITKMIVHEPGGFEAWLKEAEDIMDNLPPVELGEKMYSQQGCATCHSTDGTAKTGPSFQGIWGKTETMTDGSTIVVDENYIRESILEPQAKIVQGYPPSMPTYKGKLSDKKIEGLIAFIKAQK